MRIVEERWQFAAWGVYGTGLRLLSIQGVAGHGKMSNLAMARHFVYQPPTTENMNNRPLSAYLTRTPGPTDNYKAAMDIRRSTVRAPRGYGQDDGSSDAAAVAKQLEAQQPKTPVQPAPGAFGSPDYVPSSVLAERAARMRTTGQPNQGGRIEGRGQVINYDPSPYTGGRTPVQEAPPQRLEDMSVTTDFAPFPNQPQVRSAEDFAQSVQNQQVTTAAAPMPTPAVQPTPAPAPVAALPAAAPQMPVKAATAPVVARPTIPQQTTVQPTRPTFKFGTDRSGEENQQAVINAMRSGGQGINRAVRGAAGMVTRGIEGTRNLFTSENWRSMPSAAGGNALVYHGPNAFLPDIPSTKPRTPLAKRSFSANPGLVHGSDF